MKNIKNIKNSILFIIMSIVLVSCEDKGLENLDWLQEPNFENPMTLTSSSENVEMSSGNDNATAITFTWTKGNDRGAGTTLKYIFRMDIVGNNFGEDTVLMEEIPAGIFTKSFTVGELNTLLNEKWGYKGTKAKLEAEIIARVDNSPQYQKPELATTSFSAIGFKLPPPNLVEGGTFDVGDESKWTVLNISSSPSVAVNFTGGKAVWTGGSWGHIGIYQAVHVIANTKYQVNMNISGSGTSDVWFEVYVGTAVPQQGNDYNSGGMLLGLSTWNGCGNAPFDGLFTELACRGNGGVAQFPTTGTAYLVIRSGGTDLGTTGISIDNVELRAIEQ